MHLAKLIALCRGWRSLRMLGSGHLVVYHKRHPTRFRGPTAWRDAVQYDKERRNAEDTLRHLRG